MTRKTPFILLAACLMTLSLSAPLRAEDAAHDTAGGGTAHEERGPIPKPKHAIAPAVTTLIVFALLVAVLAKYAWGPIASGLKAREDKIRRDIADAEAARARAEATLRDYNQQLAGGEQKVRDMINKAAADAEQIANGIRSRAQQEAEESRERATRDIEAAKQQAISEIYEQAATLATSVAEKILRRNLNADDQRALVAQSLEQMQNLQTAGSASGGPGGGARSYAPAGGGNGAGS